MEEELIFHDITDASDFGLRPEVPWWAILIGLLVLLLIILVVVKYLKSSSTVGSKSPSAFKTSLDGLKEIRERGESQTLNQTATDLSLLLRGALEQESISPSVYQSQQEVHTTESLALADSALSQELRAHLDELWSLEYAQPKTDHTRAYALTDTTESLLKSLDQADLHPKPTT